MLVAEKTLNIFLLAGISNINIFFLKKKNDVELIETFMFSLMKEILLKTQRILKKKIQKYKEIDITKTNLFTANTIDFHLRG